MLIWMIKISIISLIFIFLVHHLIIFFKTALTVPKIKDLVNSSNEKYKHIIETISNNNQSYNSTPINLLPTDELDSMRDELKLFLKSQTVNLENNDLNTHMLDNNILDNNNLDNNMLNNNMLDNNNLENEVKDINGLESNSILFR